MQAAVSAAASDVTRRGRGAGRGRSERKDRGKGAIGSSEARI